MHKITLIPGDGIGPEVTRAAKSCVEATGVKIEWEEVVAGEKAEKEFGSPLPVEVLDSVRRNKVALKGPIITPIASGFRSVNVQLRQSLNLFACLRPSRLLEGIRTRFSDVDLVVIRENTEGLYAGIEFAKGEEKTKDLISYLKTLSGKSLPADSALSLRPISRLASERIVRFAFGYALKNKRKKVTIVHKANILKYTDGLFLNVARKLAALYQDIKFEEAIIDNLAMQLVRNPQLFDVLVLPNLYGDIISDLCAGLVGGLGVAPGANIGEKIAVFEPVHGAAPKYAGLNKVNPTAMILSACLMLRHIAEEGCAQRLEEATRAVIKEGKSVTYDLKENRNDPEAVGTQQMAEAIIEKIKNQKSKIKN